MPQRGFQGSRKADRIETNFSLIHEASLIPMRVLDRILDGDDVGVPGAVDVVDHRGQRGTFAAAGGAGDQDQAAPLFGNPLHYGRQVQLRHRANFIGDDSHDYTQCPALAENVDAEATEFRAFVGKIGLQFGSETTPMVIVQHRIHCSFHELVGHGRGLRHRHEIGLKPNCRRSPNF